MADPKQQTDKQDAGCMDEFSTHGKFKEAVEEYGLAIDIDPYDALTYANRCVGLVKLEAFDRALEDAETVIRIQPDWARGYVRKGQVYMAQHSYGEAMIAFMEGLNKDPMDPGVRFGITECRSKMTGQSKDAPLVNPWADKFLWEKIRKDPQTRKFMEDRDYKVIIGILQKEPKRLKEYISDERVQTTLSMLLGANADLTPDCMKADNLAEQTQRLQREKERQMQEAKRNLPGEKIKEIFDDDEPRPSIIDLMEEPEAAQIVDITDEDPEDKKLAAIFADKPEGTKIVEITDEDDDADAIEIIELEDDETEANVPVEEKRQEKKVLPMETNVSEIDALKALEEKEKGNAAYKKKDFSTAISHYDKAIELDGTNITFRTNKAAVLFEQGEYDACIALCDQAVEVGRENRADYKLIAKAFARAGNAYSKKEDYANALKFYNKSLSEHRDREVAKKVQEIQKLVAEKERLAYIDPEKSLEEKAKGNQFFTKGDYPSAIKHYTEAIKRNPEDAKIFSNRAACYTKLAEFNMALRDAEECIRLDPKFIKGYLRKGNIHMALKQSSKAGEAYQKALEIDSNCQEAIDGYRKSVMADSSDPEEIRKRAMQNPEVQQILADPAMQLILQQMQKDPNALHEHLKNPEVAKKIEKLLESGLIAIR